MPGSRVARRKSTTATPRRRRLRDGGQDAILSAVNFAAERFLQVADWRQAVQDVLARLGHAAGADRIVIFQNSPGERGDVLISLRHEWTSAPAYVQPSALLQNLPLESRGFGRWIRELGAGRSLAAPVRTLPSRERSVLTERGIRSIVVVPIFVDAHWWGFFGFDACAAERAWGRADIEALSAAARIFGEAIRRERTESALRASETRYRTLAESAQDAIFIIDPDLRVRYLNQCGANWMSASPDAFVGKTLAEVFGGEVGRRYGARITEILRTGEPAYFESAGAAFRGKEWLGTHLAPLRNAAGGVTGVLGICRDLTDRWRAEQARREGDARLHTLADTIDDAVIVADASGDVVLWNRGAAQLFQFERHEILGRSASILVPELFRPLHVAGMHRVQAGEAPVFGKRFEALGLRKDGSTVSIEISLASWRELDRRFSGAIIRDISARKKAEAAVRQREAELREAQRVARLGSWEWTIATGAHTWSDELYRLHGLEPDAPVTHLDDVERFVTPESWTRLSAAMDEILRTGQPFELDLQRVRVDGTIFWATTRGEAVRDAHGAIVGTRGTVLDITQRKLAENALLESEARLRQAQKMEAVGQLAGGIAHDFNNLLTAICGYAAVAMESLDDGTPIKADVAEIKKAGDRAAALTRQLLAFGRKQVFQPQVLDVGQVLAGVDAMLRRVIGENITLTTTPAPDLWPIEGDPGQVEQILLNLAVNSRDAMPEGGTLSIDARNVEWDESLAGRQPEARPGRYVALDVHDTGCGMTPEVKSHMFEPFFTTKEVGKGTGLGLSTVYGIVKQSGGFIDVDTAVGRGTTFSIYLPTANKTEASTSQRAPSAPPVPGSETLLVVEDEPGVRTLIVRTLERHGYSVLEARDPAQALATLDRHPEPIHLLITDMVMPGTNGRRLAAQVAALRPNTRTLLISGYAAAMAEAGQAADRTPFLAKPFTPSALLEAVRRTLDADDGWRDKAGRIGSC